MAGTGFDRFDLAAIGAGGLLGAALRWGITRPPTPDAAVMVRQGSDFPFETLIVNATGCLVLGGVTVLLAAATSARRRALLALGTGLCGSLTTFSSFAVELADRLGARSTADPGLAMAYLAVSVAAGGAAFVLGRVAGRLLA